jgi:hypothetical protein
MIWSGIKREIEIRFSLYSFGTDSSNDDIKYVK